MTVWPIYKKELRLYFTTPLAWAVIFIFLLVMGFFFWLYFTIFTRASMQAAMNPAMARDLSVIEYVMRPLFSGFLSVILFLSLVPAITMRLVSEERRSGTLELLMTHPVTDGAIVMGKFLGALALWVVMLAVSLIHMGLLFIYGNPEWKPLLAAYLGLLLMGGAFIALGLMISSTTNNQIVAGVITFVVFLLLWIVGWFGDSAGPWMGPLTSWLSITEHFDDFSKGIIDTKHVLYYVSLITFGLFLTAKSVDTERWRD